MSPPAPDEPRTYGGFLTQDDIRELIQYAADRFVDILPEIDVPGHSMAAVASYPHLSCTPGTYSVNSGEKVMNWFAGGFTAIIDNTLCPANDSVYIFLDKVFTEVAQLFPFGYIHMGGDECAKNFWERSAAVKELMRRQKLKSMNEVQSYFVKRVAKIIESKGKKMIGWDEILEGGIPASAAVMSWRGTKGGVEAAKMGREVVMSPSTNVYLDLMQGDSAVEPRVYSSVLLRKSYEFEPVPDGVDARFIKGGQANLWTEQIYNLRHAGYMLWPRAFAVSEALWSPREQRDYDAFIARVEQHFARLDSAGTKYARSMYDPIIKASRGADSMIQLILEPQISGMQYHYSFDNSYPDALYPVYSSPVAVPIDAEYVKLIGYRNGHPEGRMITMRIDELKKRIRKQG